MANDTRRLRVVVTGESKDAQQSLEQVGNTADKTESKLGGLAKTVAGFAGKGILAFGAVGAAAATMGVQTATQMEQASVGFTTMLGSGEKAQVFLKQLQAFANSTPFEFTELTGAAQRLMAMGFQARDVIPMLTSVGDAVAAMGGGKDSIDAVTNALGQMQAKGKVSGEELMQLTEQGIPALRILADAYGVSTADMSAMITKGMVMTDKAIPALISGLEHGTKSVKGFGGMMNAQSQTMAGQWSTFMDTLQSGLGNIAIKFFPMIKVAISAASKAFGDFFAGLQGKGKLAGFTSLLNQIGLGLRAMIGAFKEGDVTSKGLVGTFELVGVTVRGLIKAFQTSETSSGGWRHELELVAVAARFLVDTSIQLAHATATTVDWLKQNQTVAKILAVTIGLLVAVTKAHAIATGVEAAGGLMQMFKNTSLVNGVMKVSAALQWAWNGAIAAAGWTQAAAGLAAMVIQQKAMAVWSKLVTAAQWLWNIALDANPLGLIVIAIAAVVGAIVLLWKNNEGFRNFVLNVLWPALKKAWEGIKAGFEAAIHGIIVAWEWLRDKVMAVWNAVWAFLAPVVQKIIAIITPIASVIGKIGSVVWAFYTNAWKVVWILIQIAVKVFVYLFQTWVLPTIQGVFKGLTAVAQVFASVWRAVWGVISGAASRVASWFTGTIVPSFRKAWDQMRSLVNAFKTVIVNRWNEITGKIKAAYTAISGPIASVLSAGLNKIRGWLNSFKSWWFGLFDGMRNKSKDVMDKVVSAFYKGRDGIKRAWESVVNITKKPINFVINDVYNDRIRALWNKVAGAFGISTRLDVIKGFAKGGTVGTGYGTKDDQLAVLTRGEGVLTTKEMRKLGGPTGFEKFRQSLAQYNKGGVVGGSSPGGDGIGSWFSSLASKAKNLVQGMAGPVIKPLANAIKGFVNRRLGGDGWSGMLSRGLNVAINKFMGWVSGKDKAAATNIGGGGGNGMGYQKQMAILRTAFPGLPLISGFRPNSRTLGGNVSYHASGRAVDVPPRRDVANWIRAHYGKSTKELITPWPSLDLWNGKFHDYSRAIDAQHGVYGNNAHVHWAMDTASTVDPGWFMGYNGTGKPETLVNADKMGGNTFYVTLNINGAGDPKRIAKEVRDELISLSRRNGGKAGLPTK